MVTVGAWDIDREPISFSVWFVNALSPLTREHSHETDNTGAEETVSAPGSYHETTAPMGQSVHGSIMVGIRGGLTRNRMTPCRVQCAGPSRDAFVMKNHICCTRDTTTN